LVKIEWTEGAIKDLEKLDKIIARRALKKITWPSKNFEQVVPEHLSGELKGTYKLRVGEWRVVHTAEGKAVRIQFIGHRKEIYKIK
jgi:addiction module RelE/StbE family toxin